MLKAQKKTGRRTQGPKEEEERGEKEGGREEMEPVFPILSPVLESKRGRSRSAPRAHPPASHLPATAAGSRRAWDPGRPHEPWVWDLR